MSFLDDQIRAMRYQHPEYIPVMVSLLPATWMKYRESLDEVVKKHPILFGDNPQVVRDYDAVGGTYVEGNHTDIWGCVWSNVATGMEAIVTKHPVPTREAVHSLKEPESVTGRIPHGFMYLRLADLRGFDEIMVDFAEEPEELQMLIDIVLEHNMKELEFLLKNYNYPFISFGDDLGMQTSLPMSPKTWRKYLKPCYMKLYQRCHEAGLDVFMHTDGHIHEIIPDLIECGVNVINPQIRANGLQNLRDVCKGKVCVCLDLDRQMFPFCKPEELDGHVREAIEALGDPCGGLWLIAECGPDVPLENIDAICTALEKYRGYFRGV
ncbi:MAG: uroporphyrinogen decarboxylase family protein [Armatimonadota bacterium]